MAARSVTVRPMPGQVPGTSGLRRKTRVFRQPGYLETYVQSIFDAIGGVGGDRLVVGGDGRAFCSEACQTVLRMAAANGARRIIVGKDGLLSTPAASHLIRKRRAKAGIILSASHNPGGVDGDFGVKLNLANGGPAPESVCRAIAAASERIRSYRTFDADEAGLQRPGIRQLAGSTLEIVDPVADHIDLMESLFDFDAVRGLFASGFEMRLDAMNAVAGPYARELFEGRLGARPGTVFHADPLPDFGGRPPNPDSRSSRDLIALTAMPGGPGLAAATDGDADRHMVAGRGMLVPPSDSLAVLAANAGLVPGYRNGLRGIARTLPTSRAADRVARRLGVPLHETPTGWKHFCGLLDDGKVTICGEESFGAGSDHVREKDGLWAILFWLNLVAVTGLGVTDLLRAHWRQHGRDYSLRQDFDGLEAAAADEMMQFLRDRLPTLPGTAAAGKAVVSATEFRHVDPAGGGAAGSHGICVGFQGGGRAVYRLSGTATEGTTLRLYLEQPEFDRSRQEEDPRRMLAPLAAAASEIAALGARIGRTAPDACT